MFSTVWASDISVAPWAAGSLEFTHKRVSITQANPIVGVSLLLVLRRVLRTSKYMSGVEVQGQGIDS
jgi:hypothetical protein